MEWSGVGVESESQAGWETATRPSTGDGNAGWNSNALDGTPLRSMRSSVVALPRHDGDRGGSFCSETGLPVVPPSTWPKFAIG